MRLVMENIRDKSRPKKEKNNESNNRMTGEGMRMTRTTMWMT